MRKKNPAIDSIFKILYIYEDCIDECLDEAEYKAYLDRLYVLTVGWGNKEIYTTIKGLYILGLKASHNTVKTVVFHLVDLIKKGDVAVGS